MARPKRIARYWLGKKRPEVGRLISEKLKGRKLSDQHRANVSAALMGHMVSEATRKKISEAQKGDKGPNWQGGVSQEHKRIRRSIKFRAWREAVFARDNWTCQICGERGGELHPDHIKPFAKFPALRFELSNGRTLCAPCHRKTDTWGRPKKIKSTTI